jgi:AcrR family transcriptional regulator
VNATERRINAAALRLFAERGNLDLTMSELAIEAGLARGTLYRNVESIEQLFDDVVATLTVETHAAIASALDAHGDLDPAVRLATAMRMFVRVAHDNPAKGRFIVRFGLTHEQLRGVLSGPPMQDVTTGIRSGRYAVTEAMQLSVASLLMGTTLSAMWMVLEGHQGWREAGSVAAELTLTSLGIARAEAHQIAQTELPALPNA